MVDWVPSTIFSLLACCGSCCATGAGLVACPYSGAWWPVRQTPRVCPEGTGWELRPAGRDGIALAGLQAWAEDLERNRVGGGGGAEGGAGERGEKHHSFFGPGRPPRVQAMAHALRLHRGNVGDLCAQVRSLCHSLEDSLEGFADEASTAGQRIGGMLDAVLEAELDDRIDLTVRCGWLRGCARWDA